MEIPHALGLHVEFFTKIPWAEYRRIRHAQQILSIPETDLEMQIFRDYVVPAGKYTISQIERLPAGVVSTVVSIIMELSDSSTFPGSTGEIPLEDLTLRVNAQRFGVATQLDLQMMTTICAVFKGYTFEALGKLSFDKIIQLFAAAERHLINVGAISQPLEFGRLSDMEEDEDKPPMPEPVVDVPEQSVDSDMDLIRQYAAMDEVRKQKPKPEPKPESVVPVEVQSLPDEVAVEPVNISKTNPHRTKLLELEQKRVAAINAARASGRSQRTDFVPSTQTHVESNGVNTPVPGISHKGGMRKEDFDGLVTMTDEQAMEYAMGDELFQAGYEIIRKKEERAETEKKNTLEEEWKKRVGNKRLTLRERKILKDQLREEGFLE